MYTSKYTTQKISIDTKNMVVWKSCVIWKVVSKYVKYQGCINVWSIWLSHGGHSKIYLKFLYSIHLSTLSDSANNQWIFQVPVKGGRWYIITQLAVYTAYIPGIVLAFVWGLYNPYHLSPEPEYSIETMLQCYLVTWLFQNAPRRSIHLSNLKFHGWNRLAKFQQTWNQTWNPGQNMLMYGFCSYGLEMFGGRWWSVRTWISGGYPSWN